MRTMTIIGTLLLLVGGPLTSAADPGWRINEELGLQLVYLPAHPPVAVGADAGWTPLLTNVAPSQPDITNILYEDILGLGFPLPHRGNINKLNLFLKLYRWPGTLNARLSAGRILETFMLPAINGGQRFTDLIATGTHVRIKYALIGPSDRSFGPQDPLRVIPPSSQEDFDASLPFSSIYLLPASASPQGSERDRAAHSVDGVRAVHRELTRVYERSLLKLGTDPSRSKTYFARRLRCIRDNTKLCGLRVIELPQQPLAFVNYRELPMPQDPRRVFLSGLLLVKVTDYVASEPLSADAPLPKGFVPDSSAFGARLRPVWSHLLEVASVLDLRLAHTGDASRPRAAGRAEERPAHRASVAMSFQ